jgi:hypothetical protein
LDPSLNLGKLPSEVSRGYMVAWDYNMSSLPRLVLFGCFLFVAGSVIGQPSPTVKQELALSRLGMEIESPQFSFDGSLIVFVTRAFWPDGHEAENYSEAYFERLEKRRQKEPRFADPFIELVNLQGTTVCKSSYGWNPAVSPDNKKILYSQQKKPITGLRVLAETQDGNGIELYDCEKKQARLVAEPDRGYLDRPAFLRDANTIVYTDNEGINGSFGGAVGVELIDLLQNRKSPLLPKQTVKAVSCPPAGSGNLSRAQAFQCSNLPSKTDTFANLVLHFSSDGDQSVAVVGKSVPAPGDIYLASTYDVSLVALLPERKELFSFGRKDMGDLREVAIQAASGRTVLIFQEYWKPFSLDTGEWLSELGPRNRRRRSVYSPDLKYYLSPEPEEDSNHFVLYRTGDGKAVMTFTKMANVYDAVWSPDSKRFAIVGIPTGALLPHREMLIVYSIQ